MAILKALLWILLIYYVLKWLIKWLAPKVLTYAVKKAQDQFKQQSGSPQKPHKTGKTTIVKKPLRKANSTKKVGEYIDFEEID